MSSDTPYIPGNEAPKPRKHYHGDTVRLLFVINALFVFLTQYVGTKLPFSSFLLMLIIVTLVVAAGITNPAQRWIHWVNMIVATLGLLIFGGFALSKVVDGGGIFETKGLIAMIAILFLASLYYATSTVRGMHVRHVDPDEDLEREYIPDPM